MIFRELQPPPGVVYMQGRSDKARLVSEFFRTMFRSDDLPLMHRFIVIGPNGDVRSLPLEPAPNA